MRQNAAMEELRSTKSSRPERSLGDQFIRLVVTVLAVMVGVWLAFRVIAGVVHFVLWMIVTALVVAAVLFAFSLLFGKKD